MFTPAFVINVKFSTVLSSEEAKIIIFRRRSLFQSCDCAETNKRRIFVSYEIKEVVELEIFPKGKSE
jgi:hypothetical protein